MVRPLTFRGIAVLIMLLALTPHQLVASKSWRAPESSPTTQEENIESCTATWGNLASSVPASTWWSLATGEPQPSAYILSEGCRYDTNAPANTPLVSPPAPILTVDGVAHLFSEIRTDTGEIRFAFDVDVGNMVQIDFSFDATNAPAPTPIPSVSPIALALMAGLFAILITWRIRQRPTIVSRIRE